ncbi:MAG TPA: nucleotidyltransferase domain-containing protein [Terriglobales bacterium]|nr:nucleotidyltransferase domain-containing protein [Terriglobales bacterium]
MTPDEKLNKFVRLLRDAGGANLQSVILYGSAVSGDFHPEFSNLNVFCVLRDTSFQSLAAIESATKWWDRQRQPPPLFMTREELQRSTDVFTIEFMDMRQYHRVLLGEDVLEKLEIPTRFHRLQVEYELREKLLLLRQAVSVVAKSERKLWDLLLRSLPSFLTLFRHALLVLGGPAPSQKRECVQELSRRVGFDASSIETLLNIRERKAKRNQFRATDMVASYLWAIEQVNATVDRMLAAGVSE